MPGCAPRAHLCHRRCRRGRGTPPTRRDWSPAAQLGGRKRGPVSGGAPEAGARGCACAVRAAAVRSRGPLSRRRGVGVPGLPVRARRARRLAERSGDGASERSPAGCPRSGSLPWVSAGPAAATSRALRRAEVWGRAPEAQGAAPSRSCGRGRLGPLLVPAQALCGESAGDGFGVTSWLPRRVPFS